MIDLEKISQDWFLSEPALFAIYCMHEMVENLTMSCPVRTGKGRIEYNTNLLCQKSQNEVEELFTIEMIRAFLKHPYERQPESCSKMAIGEASDVVLGQHYKFKHIPLTQAESYQLPTGECFEWYARQINNQLWNDNSEGSGGSGEGIGSNDLDKSNRSNEKESSENSPSNTTKGKKKTVSSSTISHSLSNNGKKDANMQEAKDKAELWEEDQLQMESINGLIESLTQWGTIPGDMVSTIKASTIVHLDYRKVLSGYHTSILSSKRCLTRMRPNRRSGFLQMGSRYDLKARLAVAVDVSGSISDKTLQAFFSSLSRFFKYGVECIDVIEFDTQIHSIQPLKKAQQTYKAEGRGGTNIQPVINYLKEHNYYDGLIIFTDGYMDQPTIDFPIKAKLLWILPSEALYLKHKDWISHFGRCCWMEW